LQGVIVSLLVCLSILLYTSLAHTALYFLQLMGSQGQLHTYTILRKMIVHQNNNGGEKDNEYYK